MLSLNTFPEQPLGHSVCAYPSHQAFKWVLASRELNEMTHLLLCFWKVLPGIFSLLIILTKTSQMRKRGVGFRKATNHEQAEVQTIRDLK